MDLKNSAMSQEGDAEPGGVEMGGNNGEIPNFGTRYVARGT